MAEVVNSKPAAFVYLLFALIGWVRQFGWTSRCLSLKPNLAPPTDLHSHSHHMRPLGDPSHGWH